MRLLVLSKVVTRPSTDISWYGLSEELKAHYQKTYIDPGIMSNVYEVESADGLQKTRYWEFYLSNENDAIAIQQMMRSDDVLYEEFLITEEYNNANNITRADLEINIYDYDVSPTFSTEVPHDLMF